MRVYGTRTASRKFGGRTPASRLLKQLVPVPTECDALDSDVGFAYFTHRDLDDMDHRTLSSQHVLVLMRLGVEPASPPTEAFLWLTDRLERIEKLLRCKQTPTRRPTRTVLKGIAI